MKKLNKEAMINYKAAMKKLHHVDELWTMVIEAEGINFSFELNRKFCDLYNKRKEIADELFKSVWEEA